MDSIRQRWLLSSVSIGSHASPSRCHCAGIAACIEPLEARRLFSAALTTQAIPKPTAPPPSPIVLQARAHAAHATVTGTRTSLAALATIGGRQKGLTYTWSVAHSPGGAPPTFSANGTTAAMHVTVKFHRAGTYRLTCTIRDHGGHAITSTVSVVVAQTTTSLHLRDRPSSIDTESNIEYRADVYDQFGRALRIQPPIHYAVRQGRGRIDARTGDFHASIHSGSVEIQARSGNLSDSAFLTVVEPDEEDDFAQDQGVVVTSDQESNPPDQSDQNTPATQPDQDTTMPSTEPDQSDQGDQGDSSDSGDSGDQGDDGDDE